MTGQERQEPGARFVDGIGPPLQQINEDYKGEGIPGADVVHLIAEVFRLDDALSTAERQLAGLRLKNATGKNVDWDKWNLAYQHLIERLDKAERELRTMTFRRDWLSEERDEALRKVEWAQGVFRRNGWDAEADFLAK